MEIEAQEEDLPRFSFTPKPPNESTTPMSNYSMGKNKSKKTRLQKNKTENFDAGLRYHMPKLPKFVPNINPLYLYQPPTSMFPPNQGHSFDKLFKIKKKNAKLKSLIQLEKSKVQSSPYENKSFSYGNYEDPYTKNHPQIQKNNAKVEKILENQQKSIQQLHNLLFKFQEMNENNERQRMIERISRLEVTNNLQNSPNLRPSYMDSPHRGMKGGRGTRLQRDLVPQPADFMTLPPPKQQYDSNINKK